VTVIAWKSGIIAADRCASRGDTRFEVQKLYRSRGAIIAGTGGTDYVEALFEWWRSGADVATFPEKYQATADYAILVVAKDGNVCTYDRTPYPVWLRGPYGAAGSGREFAIGAMAAGASAEEAVMIAAKHCEGVGFGCDREEF